MDLEQNAIERLKVASDICKMKWRQRKNECIVRL